MSITEGGNVVVQVLACGYGRCVSARGGACRLVCLPTGLHCTTMETCTKTSSCLVKAKEGSGNYTKTILAGESAHIDLRCNLERRYSSSPALFACFATALGPSSM